MQFAESRDKWLRVAEGLRPSLQRQPRHPAQIVEGRRNPAAYQGWEMVGVGAPDTIEQMDWCSGQTVILDFGCHTVGYLEFDLFSEGSVDAPVRLQLVFGETAAEVCEAIDPFPGTISRSWLQDEVINVDVVPGRAILPRRYAFRYLKVATTHVSGWGVKLHLGGFVCTAVSSVQLEQAAEPPPGLPPDILAMDAISLRTLAHCMQTVFEDGPKRDRRLWLGDLRLQALVNAVSFRNFDLVKRCLYLFAALTRENGVVPADVYELPKPHRGECLILDYEALFVSTLLDYANQSGDWETARELWPVAWRQVDALKRCVDERGLFNDPGDYWLFIDWRDGLDKQTAIQGVIIYALNDALTLATRLGDDTGAEQLRLRIATMTRAARESLLLPEQGVFVSGPKQQLSWASQTWMILADVVDQEKGGDILAKISADTEAVRPAGPYLYHYVLEAMFKVGMKAEAVALMRRLWGDMMQKGATTFWEVHDPEDSMLSPYGSHLANSYCHAWSCTPAYFIRRYPDAFVAA